MLSKKLKGRVINSNLNHLNVMFCADNIDILEKAREYRHKFKTFHSCKTSDFMQMYLNSNTNLDMIVIDLDPFYESDEIIDFDHIFSIQPRQQFLFIASNRKIYKSVLKNFNGSRSTVLFKPVKISAINDNIELLVHVDKTELIKLNKNIKIDLIKEQIYDKNSQIFLTNLEHKLILLLAQNLDSIVSFLMIEEVVYGGSSTSRVSMQNMLGKLKRKLGLNIKSVHAKGYVLISCDE